MNWRELFHRLLFEDPSWLLPPRSPRLRVSFGSCLRQLFKHRIKARLGRLLTHRRSLQHLVELCRQTLGENQFQLHRL